MYKIKIEHFEGPLDLLLQLIEEQKLDISDVSLSQVAEQFIEHISISEKQIEPRELADFLTIAARLLLLKSKILLPYLSMFDEEEEADNLEDQLKLYQQFYHASKILQKMIAKKRFGFVREKFLVSGEVGFQPPLGVNAKKLHGIFLEIVQKINPEMKLPEHTVARSVSISERISMIRDILQQFQSYSFHKILKDAKDKTDVIVNFLALLELVKQKEVSLTQERVFSDIIISQVPRI